MTDTIHRAADDGGDPSRWLIDTALLQHDHPRVRLLALRLARQETRASEKALACFRYVQKLPFAWSAYAAGTTSVDVLSARKGDGCTKSTLMVALLRSLGIPARIRVVRLLPAYLLGIVDTCKHPVDHVITEVWLDNKWLGVDTYVFDLPLAVQARNRLAQMRRRCGYGVHVEGQITWNGVASSFGHFSRGDPDSLPIRDLGPYDDIQSFRATTRADARPAWTRMREWALAAALANRRIRKLRARP